MLRYAYRGVADEAARILVSCASSANALPDTLRSKSCSKHTVNWAQSNISNISRQCHSLQGKAATADLGRQWSLAVHRSPSYVRKFSSGTYPPHEILSMPALSPTMESGNLVEWKVKEGDKVEAGTLIADIETDKATLGFENQEDGFIAKLLVGNGTNDIAVGVPVAVLVDSADQIQHFENYTASSAAHALGSSSAATISTSTEAPAASSVASVQRNSRIGPAAKMALANAGLHAEDVQPTGPNGIITKSDVLAAVASGVKPKAAAAAHTPLQAQQAAAKAEIPAASPPAAVPTQTTGCASAGVPGVGRMQRGERYTDEPVSNMRRVIAQRLLQSKQTLPAIYVTASARLKALTELRGALKTAGIKASVNDFVIKAVAKALVAVPGACAGWNEASSEIMSFSDVDVSVAVATEGGLITPIVKAADKMSISEIGTTMKDLAGRARENQLKPEEFMGGSFSISNLGMFGIKEFSAIINPPQACILAVGGPQHVCVKQGDHLVMDAFMNVRLSADNRAVDEATAAEFLDSFTFHIENPGLLMA